MAKKILGYSELEWICPNCNGVNPGPVRICSSCGAPQPADVKFQSAVEHKLVQDEKAKEAAQAGEDVHCPYCGNRNPGGSTTCQQCGGDLKEAQKREAGQIVGAFQEGPVAPVNCPRCNMQNPASAKTCQHCGASMERKPQPAPTEAQPPRKPLPVWLIAVIVVACLGVFALIFFLTRTEETRGTVENVSWKRIIPILALAPVNYSGWQDEIPAGAEVGDCRQEIRETLDQPVPNSVELCGTPYQVDTGGGYAEVVQDCVYQVYAEYCNYTVEEMRQVDQIITSGSDHNPTWPSRALAAGQQTGQGQEIFTITFNVNGKSYTFTTTDVNLFLQTQSNDTWNLEINNLGKIVNISP